MIYCKIILDILIPRRQFTRFKTLVQRFGNNIYLVVRRKKEGLLKILVFTYKRYKSSLTEATPFKAYLYGYKGPTFFAFSLCLSPFLLARGFSRPSHSKMATYQVLSLIYWPFSLAAIFK